MNANAQLKQLSNQDHLKQFDPDDLLEAFLHRYNDQNAALDQLTGENQLLQQSLDGYKRQCHEQIKELEEVREENETCRNLALEAEKIANKSSGLTTELARARAQIQTLQKQLKDANAEGSPKKLKAQVKRLKDKDADQKKRIASQEQVIKTLRHSVEQKNVQQNQAFDKIASLQKQLAHDTGSGLYHNGEHHLIIWPQKTKMLDSDGNTFEGRSLLYLHQSGRGGLMTYNPTTEQVNLCAAPRGGLRPSEDLKQFAQDWLFKVNDLQDGIVKEEDMIPVNYNGDFEK